MTYNNENALAEVKNFTLPAMIESDFSNEELSEDFDLKNSTLEEMDKFWDEAKKIEKLKK